MSEQYSFSTEKFVLVARVAKAHGLKGEIKVSPLPDQAEDLRDYSRVALVANDGRMTTLLELKQSRPQGKQIILKLDTIDTRNEAELTAGMGVLLPREDLPKGRENNDSPHRFSGLVVKTKEPGRSIGIVDAIFHNGAHEILVVRSGETEFLIPLIDEFIVEYNDREILIDPPPGLLDLASDQDTDNRD